MSLSYQRIDSFDDTTNTSAAIKASSLKPFLRAVLPNIAETARNAAGPVNQQTTQLHALLRKKHDVNGVHVFRLFDIMEAVEAGLRAEQALDVLAGACTRLLSMLDAVEESSDGLNWVYTQLHGYGLDEVTSRDLLRNLSNLYDQCACCGYDRTVVLRR